MVSYEKSELMIDRATKKYAEGKLDANGFIIAVKKAGYSETKAKEYLKKAEVAKTNFEEDKAKIAAQKAADKAAYKVQADKAAQMKKDNGGVPTVEQVFAKPLRGQPVLGNSKRTKVPGDKKPIITVDDVLANYDPDKSILNRKLKSKKTTKKQVNESLRNKYILALSEDKAEVPTVDNVLANYDPDKSTLGRDINGNKLAPTPKERAAAKRKALAAKKKAEKEKAKSLDAKVEELKEELGLF